MTIFKFIIIQNSTTTIITNKSKINSYKTTSVYLTHKADDGYAIVKENYINRYGSYENSSHINVVALPISESYKFNPLNSNNDNIYNDSITVDGVATTSATMSLANQKYYTVNYYHDAENQEQAGTLNFYVNGTYVESYNVGNYERHNYKELGFDRLSSFYFQKP